MVNAAHGFTYCRRSAAVSQSAQSTIQRTAPASSAPRIKSRIRQRILLRLATDSLLYEAAASSIAATPASLLSSSSFSDILSIDQATAEALAGPFFGLSLFPYLAFLYFLNVPQNNTPKGVTVGFATCLLFVFLTIPAAIAAKVLYGVSLADCDWLHGSAESLLTVTNLVTVLAFRQALLAKENGTRTPLSAESYMPMTLLVAGCTAGVAVTAAVPALSHPQVHTPYLGGFLDLPLNSMVYYFGANEEPANALSVGCWIIHVSSLFEFLVAMGFCWRWADVVDNPKWKGLTWGLLPLHSSGITACTYHLLYNHVPVLVPLQAFLTCIGNTTAANAAWRIAVSNGWKPELPLATSSGPIATAFDEKKSTSLTRNDKPPSRMLGFEDLGDVLATDSDISFLLKLFATSAVVSYIIKYGEVFVDFPYEANAFVGLSAIVIPSAFNAIKWYKRGQDETFEGWM
jgi:hypothetical protein